MKKIIVLVCALLLGVCGGYFAVKAGVAKTCKTEMFTANSFNKLPVTLKGDYDVDDLYADVKDVDGFKGLYPQAAFVGDVEVDKKASPCIIDFESPYATAEKPYIVSDGRPLNADDDAASTVNVLVGGVMWKDYAVGDTATIKISSQKAEQNLSVCIVGKIETPFYPAGLASNEDAFKTLGATLILPSCPAEFAVTDKVFVYYTGADFLLKIKDNATVNGYSVNTIPDMNSLNLADAREKEAGKAGLYYAIAIICAVVIAAAFFLLKNENKGWIFCGLSGVLGAIGTIAASLLQNSVPYAYIAKAPITTAIVIVAVCFIVISWATAIATELTERAVTTKKGTDEYKDLTAK